MNNSPKSDLRDQVATTRPHATTNLNDVEFAGDENRKTTPSSGRLVTPDPGNVPDGQAVKG